MVSTAGLEPARVSPHAPQTCAYTDSATSTQYSIFILYGVYLPSRKTILNRFSRQSATSTQYLIFNKTILSQKKFLQKKLADEGSACNVGEFMSRTVQDTRRVNRRCSKGTTGVKSPSI